MRQNSSAELLRTPAEYLKGVGPQRAELLAKLGLHKAVDFLFFFPRDYLDMTDRRDVTRLEPKKVQTVSGTIRECTTRDSRRGPVTKLVVSCDGSFVIGLWFNIPFFIRREFAVGRRVLMTGKPKFDPPFWTMVHPNVTYLTEEEAEDDNTLDPYLPVYPLTEGVRQIHLRKIIRPLLTDIAPLLDEVFPDDFLIEHRLLSITEAVQAIHFPKNLAEKEAARRRFVFQELFVLQLGLAMRRVQHHTLLKARAIETTPKIDTQIRQLFPFTLTDAQNKVIREITHDMAKPVPMNRLLQGDVGSGKTLVAVFAMFAAVANGFQAVFMAPTEVLARQHLRTIRRLLENTPVKIAPMFGGQTANERATVLQQIRTGDAQLVLGTQALLSNEIPFHNLGLVVIDEQHKFGVRQRAMLRTSTKFDPHYLVMTATPIPRSVTMTLFGDLDVSLLDAMPPGRQKIHTYFGTPETREKWYDFQRKKLDTGRQGFVVVPLIEESENFDAHSLETVLTTLQTGPFAGYRLGSLHGRMTPQEKERIMLDFRSGEIQLLVATTVVEVGVDVPNATLMTIESAERFGIAQLHQLRGRIGRGTYPSYCTIFTSPSAAMTPSSSPSTEENDVAGGIKPETEQRLKAFVGTTDGFALAETDFEIRGAGDLFGTKQHGLPPFRMADLCRDRAVLYEARNIASEMVSSDAGLAKPEHARLRKQLLARYGAVLELGDVG